MVLRMKKVVVHELHRLCIYQRQVLSLYHSVCQLLMDEFPKRPPLRTIVHDKQMITFRDEVMGNKRRGPVIVQSALFVHGFFDETSVGDHSDSAVAHFERVKPAVLFGPFGKPDEA